MGILGCILTSLSSLWRCWVGFGEVCIGCPQSWWWSKRRRQRMDPRESAELQSWVKRSIPIFGTLLIELSFWEHKKRSQIYPHKILRLSVSIYSITMGDKPAQSFDQQIRPRLTTCRDKPSQSDLLTMAWSGRTVFSRFSSPHYRQFSSPSPPTSPPPLCPTIKILNWAWRVAHEMDWMWGSLWKDRILYHQI